MTISQHHHKIHLMGKLLKSISIRRLANRDLHEEDRQQIKDLLFILERLMLELIGN
jgi:hypothetical protein